MSIVRIGFGALLAVVLAADLSEAVTINEIRIDQYGADDDEFVELHGLPAEALSNLTYLVIGDVPTGVIECVVSLAGHNIPADGFFLVTENPFTLLPLAQVDLVLAPNVLNFENSDNVTHLLVSGFTGSQGDNLDPNGDCVLDLRPWTSIVDGVAVIEEPNPPINTECHYGDDLLLPVIGPDGVYSPAHVAREEDGVGLWRVGLFETIGVYDTPGASNNDHIPMFFGGFETGDTTRWSVTVP